jgi:type I restriction enzyme, S subunit
MYQTVRMGEFLKHRSDYFIIDDFQAYKRARVQLHERGIIQRDTITGSQIRTKKQQAAKTGEFLVAEIDAKVGGFGIVPPELDGAIVSSHYFLFEIDQDLCLREWLDYFVRSGLLTEQVAARGSTNYASIRPHHVLDFEIPLPSLTEQRRLVGRIEALAGKVEEARRLRATAVKETSLLLQSAKQTLFDPEKMKKQLWIEHHLGSVAEIRSGVTLGRVLTGRTIKLPYLRVANVQDGYLDLNEVKEVEIREGELEKWQLQQGDILLTEGGDWDKLGRGVVWKNQLPNCIHQNHIFRLRVDRGKFNPYFLLALISSPYGKAYFQGASKQTTNLASINQRQLKAFAVFQPDFYEQERIVNYLQGLQLKLIDLQKLQESTQKELDALLPSILDKAFKGEL